MLKRRSALALPLALCAAPALAQVPAWPCRGPIHLVPTEGLVDTIARLIAPPLAQFIG